MASKTAEASAMAITAGLPQQALLIDYREKEKQIAKLKEDIAVVERDIVEKIQPDLDFSKAQKEPKETPTKTTKTGTLRIDGFQITKTEITERKFDVAKAIQDEPSIGVMLEDFRVPTYDLKAALYPNLEDPTLQKAAEKRAEKLREALAPFLMPVYDMDEALTKKAALKKMLAPYMTEDTEPKVKWTPTFKT